jgi:hypothetical protein
VDTRVAEDTRVRVDTRVVEDTHVHQEDIHSDQTAPCHHDARLCHLPCFFFSRSFIQ